MHLLPLSVFLVEFGLRLLLFFELREFMIFKTWDPLTGSKSKLSYPSRGLFSLMA